MPIGVLMLAALYFAKGYCAFMLFFMCSKAAAIALVQALGWLAG
jgi:hypothetical protein